MEKNLQNVAVNRAFSVIRSCRTPDQVRVATRYAAMAVSGLPGRYREMLSAAVVLQQRIIKRRSG